MFELIPSEYMKKIFGEERFELTDFQKATLIWNASDKNRDEKMTALRELSENTDDADLHRQIMERLQYEGEALRRFMDNSSVRYVYVIKDDYRYSCGFFAEFNMAKRHLLKYLKGYDMPFDMEKQVIVRNASDLRVREQRRPNPKLFPENGAERGEKFVDYEGLEISKMSFDADGNIKDLISGEMSKEEEKMVDKFKPERFEYHFMKIPFQGWRGTPVRDVTDHYASNAYRAYGILVSDTESWKKYLHRIEERNYYADFSDVNVSVYFLNEQGIWTHEHVNPIYLEVERPLNYDDEKAKAYMRAMKAFGDYWIHGKEEYNGAYAKTAIKMAKEYRDICLEHYVREQKRKCGLVDRAETIYDIMI